MVLIKIHWVLKFDLSAALVPRGCWLTESGISITTVDRGALFLWTTGDIGVNAGGLQGGGWVSGRFYISSCCCCEGGISVTEGHGALFLWTTFSWMLAAEGGGVSIVYQKENLTNASKTYLLCRMYTYMHYLCTAMLGFIYKLYLRYHSHHHSSALYRFGSFT